MSRIRRILHPTDFSRASSAAYKRAVDMAKGNRAELVLVHVLGPAVPLMADGYVSPKIYDDMEAAERAYSQKHLTPWSPRPGRRGCGPRGCWSRVWRTSASPRRHAPGRPTSS